MPRTQGATDVVQRKRRTQTPAEKAAATKKRAQESAAAAARAKAALISSMGAGNLAPSNGGAAAAPANGGTSAAAGERERSESESERSGAEGSNQEEQASPEGESDSSGGARPEHRPPDVEAELDDDEQLQDADAAAGVMGTYLKAVYERLHSEVCGTASRATLGDQWLLALLKAPGADWWLRAGVAQSVCRKLGIEYGEPSYYRDIYVWLPDVRWGDEAMPPCVECHSAEENANVGHRGLPIQLQRTDSDCVHTQKRTERAFAMTLHVTTRAQLCTLVPCTYAGIYARPEEICEFSPSFPPFLALFIIFPPPPFASRVTFVRSWYLTIARGGASSRLPL